MKKTVKGILACLLCFALAAGWAVPAAAEAATPETQQVQVFVDQQAAVEAIREQMVARQEVIRVAFLPEVPEDQLLNALLDGALAHTGVPTQGDYLRWHCKRCSIEVEETQPGSQLKTVTLTFVYRSNAQQEAQVDTAVAALLEELDLDSANDYEKICAVYDYICRNVTYDNWGYMTGNALCYTAYAALIENSAVCQGYASLFYRLALELGVDNRVIAGTSRNRSHGWNIVRMGDWYYNVDATWDAQLMQEDLPYAYFLRGEEGFTEHSRKDTYATEEFMRSYPMAAEDFSGLPGDLDGNMLVDEDDAVYLLQHVLMPDQFAVAQQVDYTRDGTVDESDAIYLLLYVLMPEDFPLS